MLLIILALVALVAVAFFIKGWQIRRTTKAIIQCFREHRAVKEEKAKTLEEMGLHSSPKYPFLIRDTQVEALSLLLRQELICQAKQKENIEEARFYFDEQKYPMA